MSFEDVSEKLTQVITHELNYDEEKKEIIAYSLETALLSISGTVLLIILGYSLNVLLPSLIAAGFGVLLRRVSGGAHFNTPLKCLVTGAISYAALGFLAQQLVANHIINKYALSAVLLLALLIVALLAPVESEAKPIHSRSLKLKLKLASMFFVLVVVLFVVLSSYELANVSAVLGVLFQSLTLLPIFNRKGGEDL